MAIVKRERIPAAITGGILAAFTVFLSVSGVLPAPYIWNFGAWAIFITWAGYFAAGGGGPGTTQKTLKKMYPCIIWGSFWGFMAGVAFTFVNPTFGSNTAALLIFDFIVIFLVNQPILWGSKYIKTLAYTPAHFYGFATFFATYFGGFGLLAGFDGTAVVVAWLCGLAMNLLGPLWGHMQVYFTFSKEVEVPDEQAKAKAG